MNHSGIMNMLYTSKQLVHEELLMLSGDILVDSDHLMKVRVHVLSDHVQLIESLRVRW